MLCKKPYMIGVVPCACGQCMPCRINRRRLWKTRMMLESFKHRGSSFLTLTYAPVACSLKTRELLCSCDCADHSESLRPKDVQLWLKRIRRDVEPVKVRFFLVGEYGDTTQRPHYHVAFFGIGPLDRVHGRDFSAVVNSSWSHGYSMAGDLTADSAQYIAGYVTKKLTKKGDPKLYGRHPEFSRMSLRPGIGAVAMGDVAAAISTDVGLDWIVQNGDAPHSLKQGLRGLPLGRYLRRRLRGELGFVSKDVPEEAIARFAEEMRSVFKEAFKCKEVTSKTMGQIIVDLNSQKVKNLESRTKIYAQRKEL